MTWTIAVLWLLGHQDNVYVGQFKNQQACISALKQASLNFEIEPSAKQCILVKEYDLHALKEKEYNQSWLGVPR